MSNPRFPPELLDHVIDHLQDTRDALESCCLVSKSQIPRARKHLFAHVRLRTAKDLQSLKSTFPDPLTSPVYHTQILSIEFLPVGAATDAEEGGWIPTRYTRPPTSLIPFHGFSPALKPPHLDFPAVLASDVFSPIYSFPLLEDLCVGVKCGLGGGGYRKPAIIESHTPLFTGTLKVSSRVAKNSIAS